jgi:Zn2+/Cd2+-exporting ATPase
MTSQLVRIASMDCAAEESEIRRALGKVTGIASVNFQLSARTIEIAAEPAAVEQALEAIRAAGFDPQPIVLPSTRVAGVATPAGYLGLGKQTATLVLALILAIGAEVAGYFMPEGLTRTAIEMAFAAAAVAFAGLDVHKKGFVALFRGRLNINALMSVAVTGAFLIGQWPEAAMVMALYAIAEMIEARSIDRARNAIKTLMALAPEEASVRQPEGSWATTAVTAIPLEAVLRIRPGERIPLDGTVTSGSSAVNQAPVTGESIPVDKTEGDTVYAATINETAELEMRVTAAVANTMLARIIHSVEQAQGSQAPTQRFVDRFAAVYTPAVFFLALAVALGMPLLLHWTWLDALYKALVLLVVACPCALVISTPVTVVSALASAARRGILIKGGIHLEEARRVKVIALDKTGTITEGKPRLVEYGAIDGATLDETALVSIAASLAARSDHPVSRAIAEGLPAGTMEVKNFKALAGRGVAGRVGEDEYVLGNHRLIEEMGLCGPKIEAQLKTHEDAGRTVTLLASKSTVLGVFAVADTIKETSRQAIDELRRLRVRTIMLSGDNSATAQAIAIQAGIDAVQGNLLPEDKLNAIKDLQQRSGFTAMTGDGINDAPALAAADLGFAMGVVGTDTAIEAADIVVMNDDLRRIPEAIQLSRKTHAVLWQNITLALAIKAVFLVLTLFGTTTMWMAVFADMGASLLVVANGLRMLRFQVE